MIRPNIYMNRSVDIVRYCFQSGVQHNLASPCTFLTFNLYKVYSVTVEESFYSPSSTPPLEALSLKTDLERVEYLQDAMIAYATNGIAENSEYQQLRKHLLQDDSLRQLLPKWVRSYRSLDAFWHYISFKFPTYLERKTFIKDGFLPVRNYLRTEPRIWERVKQESPKGTKTVHDSLSYNPEGALTLAVINLENACRKVLLHKEAEGQESFGLYALFQEALKALELDQAYIEDSYEALLQALSETVSALDLLNDDLNAGKQMNATQTALAVELATSVTNFLNQSLQDRRN